MCIFVVIAKKIRFQSHSCQDLIVNCLIEANVGFLALACNSYEKLKYTETKKPENTMGFLYCERIGDLHDDVV